MKKLFLGAAFALALTSTGKVLANDLDQNEGLPDETAGQSTHAQHHRLPRWLCESVPTWGPGYYWWLSYNYAVSYRNATWACQSRHGACYTVCRVVW